MGSGLSSRYHSENCVDLRGSGGDGNILVTWTRVKKIMRSIRRRTDYGNGGSSDDVRRNGLLELERSST